MRQFLKKESAHLVYDARAPALGLCCCGQCGAGIGAAGLGAVVMIHRTIGIAELWCGDCLLMMKEMPSDSVDAIITDPPYFQVKGDEWDNQWATPDEFIAWVGELAVEFKRILKQNGSLYFFAWHSMAAMIEVEISKQFNVLNQIVWRKGTNGKKPNIFANKARKEGLRMFCTETERIIFCEQFDSNEKYASVSDDLRGFVLKPLRDYIIAELKRSGCTKQSLNDAIGLSPRGMAYSHYFSASQWQLPNAANYKKIQSLVGPAYFCREYDELKQEYDRLKQEYDRLKQEYEKLRRPFNVTKKDQWTDVWEFDPVAPYPDKHPCEKPVPLLQHMLSASVKPGGVVFDPFMGSGSMGDACHAMGCKFVGVELSPRIFDQACERIENAQCQGRLAL